jgi:hypothetical protein
MTKRIEHLCKCKVGVVEGTKKTEVEIGDGRVVIKRNLDTKNVWVWMEEGRRAASNRPTSSLRVYGTFPIKFRCVMVAAEGVGN